MNLTQLAPGAVSALAHSHSKQEEFILVLEGNPTLVLGEEEFVMHLGDCYLQAGTGIAHQLINRFEETVTSLEIGDRTEGVKLNTQVMISKQHNCQLMNGL